MRSRIVFLGAFVLCAVAYSEPAFGLDPSGEVVAVVQSTSASGPGGSRTLSETLPVYSGDTIATGGIGQAQIRFEDQTRLVVGPNSSVVIDRFVLASGGSSAGATMRFAKGAFRFITGSGPSSGYRLQTPTATIGIRGTELDITVGGRAGTAVVVFDGAVQVCNRRSGKCVVIDRSCGAVIASPDGALTLPGSTSERAALIQTTFPLARSQRSLRRDFRVDTTSCGNSPGGQDLDDGDVHTRAARAAPAPDPDPEPPAEGPKEGPREGQQARQGQAQDTSTVGNRSARGGEGRGGSGGGGGGRGGGGGGSGGEGGGRG